MVLIWLRNITLSSRVIECFSSIINNLGSACLLIVTKWRQLAGYSNDINPYAAGS